MDKTLLDCWRFVRPRLLSPAAVGRSRLLVTDSPGILAVPVVTRLPDGTYIVEATEDTIRHLAQRLTDGKT